MDKKTQERLARNQQADYDFIRKGSADCDNFPPTTEMQKKRDEP